MRTAEELMDLKDRIDALKSKRERLSGQLESYEKQLKEAG
jgi:chromosome segregation ATPase